MRLLPLLAILAFTLAPLTAKARGDGNDPRPKFIDVPHFSPYLSPGTLAWAYPFEIHTGQFSTGKMKDKINAREFEKHTPNNPKKFPKELYEYLFDHGIIAPGIAGPVPPWERSYRGDKPLLWITDRTHGSTGVSMEIVRRLGKDALWAPVLDKIGMPLNFVLVRVMANWSDLAFSNFARQMIKEKHVYLYNFVHTVDDKTRIVPIHFTDLPDIPYHTTNNPFRAVISLGQSLEVIPRDTDDFFQFKLAAQLVLDDVVSWDQISDDPIKAAKKAGRYFEKHPTYVTGESAAYRNLLRESCGEVLAN